MKNLTFGEKVLVDKQHSEYTLPGCDGHIPKWDSDIHTSVKQRRD